VARREPDRAARRLGATRRGEDRPRQRCCRGCRRSATRPRRCNSCCSRW
jgi:hypothetical protein